LTVIALLWLLYPTALSQRLLALLHPWSSYLVLPLFALANAGVTLDRDLLARAVGSSLTFAVFVGLVAGRLPGILVATDMAVRAGLGALPRLVSRQQLAGAAATAGIGFTMALFVADVVLLDRVAQDEAKVGILAASATAATLGWLLFNVPLRAAGGGRRPGAGAGAAGGWPRGEGPT
jgi:NhaA family Na+:H+ antiporter